MQIFPHKSLVMWRSFLYYSNMWIQYPPRAEAVAEVLLIS